MSFFPRNQYNVFNYKTSIPLLHELQEFLVELLDFLSGKIVMRVILYTCTADLRTHHKGVCVSVYENTPRRACFLRDTRKARQIRPDVYYSGKRAPKLSSICTQAHNTIPYLMQWCSECVWVSLLSASSVYKGFQLQKHYYQKLQSYTL